MMQNRPQMPQQMAQQQQQQYPRGPHPNNMQPNMQNQAQNVPFLTFEQIFTLY